MTVTQTIPLPSPAGPRASTETTSIVTRALLTCGVAAGPLYVVVSLAQALTREGFDLTRHTWSLLSTGDLGWIQITNFIATGLLVAAGALGMRRMLRGTKGGTWGPLLLGVYGLSLIAAGVFVADPMDGFPAGTPAGPPAVFTWHSLMHLVSGAIGFLGLIAGCVVFARRFGSLGQRGWAAVQQLPIDFYDDPVLRQRAWEIADRFNLPTLYDAAFLACTELAPASDDAQREFWTADGQLLRQLGAKRPPYVHELSELVQR